METGYIRKKGREKLFLKLCAVGTGHFVAEYTIDPFVLTIGCHNGKPYVINTHPVTQPLGNGSGLVLVALNYYTREYLHEWLSATISLSWSCPLANVSSRQRARLQPNLLFVHFHSNNRAFNKLSLYKPINQ